MTIITKLLASALLLSNVCLAGFQDNRYKVAVYDGSAIEQASVGTQVTSGVLAFVYTAGTKTLATLYSDNKRTSLANPITRSQFATDDMVKFYAAASSVDIVLAHEDGSLGKYASVTPSTKALRLNRDGVEKCLIVPFSASDATETDTAVDLPYNVVVTDVGIEVVTADSTETMDVGLLSTESSGDADGFLNDIPVGSTGYIDGLDTRTGATEAYVYASYYGALFGSTIAGDGTDNAFGFGTITGHRVSYGNAVSVTYTGSSGTDTAAGYLYVYFRHIR